MILRYLSYMLFINLLYGKFIVFFLFPFSYAFRKQLRKKVKRNFIQKILYWLLHDYREDDEWGDYGDKFTNPKLKKNYWQALKWVLRNPAHNYMVEHGHYGKHTGFQGKATIQSTKKDYGRMWRTLKTNDKNGKYADKQGKYINVEKSLLGEQNITFYIDNYVPKKVFRWSYCKPFHLFGKYYYVPEFKFGWENVNWAWQSHFLFSQIKKWEGEKFKYNKILVGITNEKTVVFDSSVSIDL